MKSRTSNQKISLLLSKYTKLAIKDYRKILFTMLTWWALIAIPVLSTLSSNVTIKSSGTIVTDILPLHIEGRYIKDPFGRVVHLRGINKNGFEDYPQGAWQRPDGGIDFGVFNPDVVAANFDAMKSWGINIVRMYSTASFWIDDTENHREIVKQVASMLADRGMYLLYTFWHQRPEDPQELTLWPSQTFPNRAAFVDFWRSIAQELKGYPNVLFSLWNEPQYSASSEDEWFVAFQECIDAIRDKGAQNIISVEWGGIWVDIGEARKYGVPTDHKVEWAFAMYWVEGRPLNDPLDNLIYEFHNYRDAFQIWDEQLQMYRFPYSVEELREGYQFALVDYVLSTLNKPVICGEVGPNMWETGDELQNELEWYRNALNIFNEKEINYIAFWWWPAWRYAHLLESPNFKPNQAGQILIEGLLEG